MEYSVQKLSKTKVEISFDVPHDEWQNDIKNTYNKNKHKYAIKGFRKGKVPFNLAKDAYLDEMIYDTLNNRGIEYYEEILKKENFETVGQPDFDVKELSEDGLKMSAVIWLRPEFELATYKGLEIKKLDTTVTEEEIQAVINKELDKRARLAEVEREVRDGDTVTIDFSGSVDGEKFEGGTAEKYDLVIGSNTFIPGFEPQIIGMKKGEEKDIDVEFPADYGAPQLAGKKAVFAIKLHEVKEKQTPELDDEFVKDIDDTLNTVAEWKESISKKIKEEKENSVDGDIFNKIMDKLIETTEIELPECMVDDLINGRIQDMESRLQGMYKISFDEYCKMMGTTVEDYRKAVWGESEKQVKYELIIGEILKKEEITPSKEDLDAELDKIPEEQKNAETFNSALNTVMLNKLLAFLKENNNII